MNRVYAQYITLLMVVFLLSSCYSNDNGNDVVQKEIVEVDEEVSETDSENSLTVVESALINDFQDKGVLYTKSELQEDFIQLKSYINNHPKLYTDHDELNTLLELNYSLITDSMTEIEFLRLLTPIVSKLNCGHTSIYLSTSYYEKDSVTIKYFPLNLYFVKDKVYVSQNGGSEHIPLGSEIIAINGRGIEEITHVLLDNISADGHTITSKFALLNEWFRAFYYEIVDTSRNFRITYKKNNANDISTEDLEGLTYQEFDELNITMLADKDQPYSKEFLETYAVLDVNAFNPQGIYSMTKYKDFFDDFFEEVRSKSIQHVILDVRDNWGGDPTITSHLFSYLEKTPQPYFAQNVMDYYPGLKDDIPMAENHYEGKLYILMNGGSFSSTGHLLALLKYQEAGMFIGEESGGSFACTDASKTYTLTNTKIQYRTSTLVWEVATKGLVPGRGIMPDYEVKPTIEDYLNGVDVVKEFAVHMIEEQ